MEAEWHFSSGARSLQSEKPRVFIPEWKSKFLAVDFLGFLGGQATQHSFQSGWVVEILQLCPEHLTRFWCRSLFAHCHLSTSLVRRQPNVLINKIHTPLFSMNFGLWQTAHFWLIFLRSHPKSRIGNFLLTFYIHFKTLKKPTAWRSRCTPHSQDRESIDKMNLMWMKLVGQKSPLGLQPTAICSLGDPL